MNSDTNNNLDNLIQQVRIKQKRMADQRNTRSKKRRRTNNVQNNDENDEALEQQHLEQKEESTKLVSFINHSMIKQFVWKSMISSNILFTLNPCFEARKEAITKFFNEHYAASGVQLSVADINKQLDLIGRIVAQKYTHNKTYLKSRTISLGYDTSLESFIQEVFTAAQGINELQANNLDFKAAALCLRRSTHAEITLNSKIIQHQQLNPNSSIHSIRSLVVKELGITRNYSMSGRFHPFWGNYYSLFNSYKSVDINSKRNLLSKWTAEDREQTAKYRQDRPININID